MDQYGQLRDAVLGATQQGAPSSPLGNFPELQKLFASTFQLPLSNAGTKAQGFQTGVTVANQDAAAKEAKLNQIDALKLQAQALADKNDPSKYQQVAKQDGGYDFFDPAGKAISAYDYARVTGKNLGDILKNSQNPIDLGFNQDYQNLQDYINAKRSSKSDQVSARTAKTIEDVVKQNYGVDLAKMDIRDVVQRFQQAYPTVFGGNKAGVSPNQTFIPGKDVTPFSKSGSRVGG